MPHRAPIRLRLTAAAGALVLGACGYPEIVAGYGAKMLCSCVFVAGRDADSCTREELGAYASILSAEVDAARRTVRTTGLWVSAAEADFEEKRGCTLR